MFCPKCGVEQSDDSQFCRKCGVAQITVATSGGAAAAVAPARSPMVEETNEASKNALKWVGSTLLVLFVCGLVWFYHSSNSAPVAPPQSPAPVPQLHTLSMPKDAFTVRQLAFNYYRFVVPAGAFNVAMKGHFTATGGAHNDIEVAVLNEDEFVNWRNGHAPTNALYNSGRVTQDTINVALSNDAATYYLIFNNRFSLISPKAVEANVNLTYSTQ